jgi:hypothetical protein
MTTTAFSIELTRESLRVTNAMAGCFRIADLGTRGSGLGFRNFEFRVSNLEFRGSNFQFPISSFKFPISNQARRPQRAGEEKSNEIEHCGSGERQAS